MGVHDGHRKRLKAQFLAHGENFHDHQLLELLLCYAIPQGDVNELAHNLLDQFGSLGGVLDALPEALMHVPGVGEHTTVLLKLVPQLLGRYLDSRIAPGTVLDSTPAAYAFLRPYYRAVRNELVYLICMDAKRKVLGCNKVMEGSVNAASITLRKVMELAMAHNATTAILAHNHPSGVAIPSTEDMATTQMLGTALFAVGVELSDHLIFSDDDMVSMRDSGLLEGYPRI